MITTVYAGNETRYELNSAVADFVSVHIFGKLGAFRDYGSMAVFDNGRLVAGVLFYDWDQDAGVMQISAASVSRRWLTRNVLHDMFAFPFGQFGCQMVVLRVSPDNDQMTRIARRYGFDEYLIPRLGGRDKDQIIFTLTDDQWRSKPPHYGGPHG